jgi:hypothetical protein
MRTALIVVGMAMLAGCGADAALQTPVERAGENIATAIIFAAIVRALFNK